MERRRQTFRDTSALYIISVAARLVNLHPNTLRKYERAGFLQPSRTGGKLRLYSSEDIARLRQIKHLVEDQQINLAGVELALELTTRVRHLRALAHCNASERELRQEMRALAEEMLRLLGAAEA